MKRVLILYNNTSTYFFDRINKGKIVIKNVFDNKNWMHNKFLCLLRKINSHFTYFFYGDWYRHLNDYEKIIVFDTPFLYDKKLLKNISKRATHCKKFYYSWNIVHDEHLNKIEKKETETYGFKFYCYDKGDEYRNINSAYEYRDGEVSYYEYLEMLSKSRSILDIAQSGQDGLSLRVMEAIFFNKKLITTNKAVKDTMFYDENNILIFNDATTAEDIKQFFNKPFKEYSQEVRDYYSIEQWVERFV